MILKIFTHPKCPKCPPAKTLARQLKIENCKLKIEKYDTSTVDGLAEAAFYQVMATPSLILLDNEGKIVADWRGEVPSKKKVMEKL